MNKFVFVVVAVLTVGLVEDNLKKPTKVSAEPIKSDFNNKDGLKRVIRDIKDSNQEEKDEVFVRVKRSPDPNPQPRGGGRGGGGRGGRSGGGTRYSGGSGTVGSLSNGAIVGITFGVVGVSVVIYLFVYFCCLKN